MNKNIAAALVIIVIVALVFITIKSMGASSPDTASLPTGQDANINTMDNTNDTPVTPSSNEPTPAQGTGVKTITTKAGAGTVAAKTGDTVSMNYTGRLVDGTVFDSNVDAKFNHVEPFTFPLGAGMVIKGWDVGIVGMKVGEKRTLEIAPDYGYGARGAGAAIPPNATLIFEVELLAIQ